MSTTKTKLGRVPRPAARPAETKRPRGVEIFTDREKEQPIIKARMACTPSKQKTEFLTQFYGIGGIGKSTLSEFALKEKTEKMAVIDLDFDVSGGGVSGASLAPFPLSGLLR